MNRDFRLLSALFLLVGFFLLAGREAHAQKSILNRNYDAKTSIKIDSMFGESVKSGYRPYLVTIRNGKSRPITWTIRVETNSSGTGSFNYSSTFRVKVEPGSEAVEELLVQSPPSVQNRYSNYRYVRVTVKAPGLDSVSRGDSEQIDGSWPSIAISKKLALRNLSRLESKKGSKKRSGNDHFASSYSDLPTNWRGLTCLDLIMIDEGTWLSLSKQKKRAVMTWVRFGGKVEIFSQQKSLEELGLDPPESIVGSQSVGAYGMGTVSVRSWNGNDLPDSLVNRYDSLDFFDEAVNDDFDGGWSMIKKFGIKKFNPFLVLILLIIFAVLVGPINLFHFAKAGQRHRLFVTTPIISIAASVIIIFIILIQDGMGGKGRRIAVVDLQSDPDQRQLQITQHQLSRTGVMIQSGFENKDQMSLVPVKLPASRWNPLSQNSSQTADYSFSDSRFNGDLFRSRSEQGFHIRSVRSTRSRVELRSSGGGGPPQLFSSLEFAVSHFFYVDQGGVVWKGSPNDTISPGEELKLEASNLNELTEWLNEATRYLGGTDRKRFRSLRSQRRRFFALAEEPGKLLIDTHPSIRWKEDQVIVTGIAVDP